MIFKTFDSKIDKWSSKIGIFGKSFNELGTAVNDAFKSVIDNIDNFDENVGFWESLKDNLFSKEDTGKDWIKNSRKEIISKENIDSYIKEIDLSSAKNKLKEIFGWQEDIKNGETTWEKFFDTCKGGNEYLVDLIKNTSDLSKLEGQDLVDACNNARASVLAHNEELKNMSFSAKAGKTALQALATAGNMLAMLAITKGLELAVKGIDNWVHRAEKAKETADELNSSMKSTNESLKSQKDFIYRVEESYSKLSDGVDSLGNNISLSKEDFADYQDICNEIAKYYPEMVSAWTKEGNAVVDLKDKVNDLKAAYEGERTAALNSFVLNADDIIDSYNLNADHSSTNGFDFTSGYKQQIAALQAYSDAVKDEDIGEIANSISYLMAKGGEEFSGHDLQIALKDLGLAKYEFDQIPSYLNGVIKNLQTKLSQEENSIKQMLINMFSLDSNDYDNLSDEAYQLGTAFISSLDSAFFDGKNAGDYREFINNLLTQLTGDDKSNVKLALDSLVNFDENKGNIITSDFKDYVDNIITDLQTYLNLDENTANLIVHAKLTEDNTGFVDAEAMVAATINNVKEKLQNEFDDRVGELTLGELQIAAEQIEVSEGDLLSWDELIAKIKEVQSLRADKSSFQSLSDLFNTAEYKDTGEKLLNLAKSGELTAETLSSTEEYNRLLSEISVSADEAKSEILDMLDATDKLAGASNGISKLENAYKEFQENGFVLAETISSIPNVFKELEGFNLFEKIVGDPTSTSDQVQQAFNTLVTQYLSSQQTLAGLSENNMHTYIANLTAMGITNAEAVVNNFLSTVNEAERIVSNATQLTYSAYLRYLESKNLADLEYFQNLVSKNSGLLQALGSTYQSDYLNWVNLLQENGNAYNSFVNAIKGSQINVGPGSAALSDEGLAYKQAQEIIKNAMLYGTKHEFDPYSTPLLNLYTSGFDKPVNPNAKYTKKQVEEAQNYLNAVAEYDRLKEQLKIDLSTIDVNFGNPLSLSSSGSSTPSSSFAAPERDTTKTYDWIEKALTRIRESYDRLSKTADSVYRTFTKRNESLTQEFTHLGEQIDLNQKAYNEYMAKADAVGLSDHYKSLVQKGTISMEDITDEALQSQIESYQEYYENAMKCSDAVLELKESLADLRKEKFDLISGDYNSQLALLKKEAALIDAHISRTEEDGLMVSTEYYSSLIENETENLKTLQANRDALKASLSEALEAGEIDLDSQAFRDMQEELLGVEEAIISSNESLIEFQNTIRELNWEAFDYLQESISRITEESDFLIELLSAADLFDESGNFSKEGLAALGLHGVNYNTFLYEAEKYAEELSNLEASLASDPYDTELIARRQQLLDAQRDMIKAAEDEKQAMADLVREGIQIQLDALQELIDKRMDALKAEKDLYDYQKRIAQHTETIGAMEKQMEAYRGDTSEETRAKIQKLQLSLKEARTDLQETEYDKYISDQEQLLDDLYLRYEEILNMRLDNMEALIADLISQVNSSASEIAATLEETAKNAGSNLSNEMSSIWNTNTESIKDVITTNSSGFTEKLTTLSSTIDTIKSTLEKMLEQSNKEASDSLAQTDAATDTPAPAPAPAPAPTPAPAPAPAPDTAASGGGPSWGDWFVSKHDSYPKGKLNIDTSIVDRLKYHDIDPSFAMRRQYYSAMGGGGTYTGSASQNLWMIQQMKAHGFSQGGAIGSLIKASGEDGFILARSGEEVLSHKKLRDLKELLTPEKLQRFRENILASTPVPLSLQLPNYKKPAPVPNHLANTFSVDIGDINMYGVNDPKEFAAQLKSAICNNRSVHSLLQDVTLGEALGQNSLTKFGR